jgi:hypothetical protein
LFWVRLLKLQLWENINTFEGNNFITGEYTGKQAKEVSPAGSLISLGSLII